MENLECSGCGGIVTEILASHDYTIEQNSETSRWVKNTGNVTYVCGNCLEELDTNDIEDILKQVDEL